MKLSAEQQKKVEDNMGLVYKVILDKVHDLGNLGIYTQEDIVQIGAIGLCKAVATDKGGTFSTYAYRLIWNEICDALIYANRRKNRETVFEILPESEDDITLEETAEAKVDIWEALCSAEKAANPTVRKGIQALKMRDQGYSSREIGQILGGASDNLVCAWVSKARKYLKNQPAFSALAETYGW